MTKTLTTSPQGAVVNKTMSIVRLDGRLLTEAERLHLSASEENLHDLVLPTPPISLPALSQVEEVEAAALLERARRAQLFDPDICGEPAEAEAR